MKLIALIVFFIFETALAAITDDLSIASITFSSPVTAFKVLDNEIFAIARAKNIEFRDTNGHFISQVTSTTSVLSMELMGEYLFFVSFKTVHCLNLLSGRISANIVKDAGNIISLTWNENHVFIASSNGTRTLINIHNRTSLDLATFFTVPKSNIEKIHYWNDQFITLASTGIDIWDPQTERLLRSYPTNQASSVKTWIVSNDQIFFAIMDRIQVLNITSMNISAKYELPGPSYYPRALAIREEHIYACFDDRSIRRWNKQTGYEGIFVGHLFRPRDLESNRQWLISVDTNQTVKIWNASRPVYINSMVDPAGIQQHYARSPFLLPSPSNLDLHTNGLTFATDRTVFQLAWSNLSSIVTRNLGFSVTTIAANDIEVFASSTIGDLYQVSLGNSNTRRLIQFATAIHGLQIYQMLVFVALENEIRVYNSSTKTQVPTPLRRQNRIRSLLINNDFLFSGDLNGTILQYNLKANGALTAGFQVPQPINALCITSEVLIVGNGIEFNLTTGARIFSGYQLPIPSPALACSQDYVFIAQKHEVHQFDRSTRARVYIYEGHDMAEANNFVNGGLLLRDNRLYSNTIATGLVWQVQNSSLTVNLSSPDIAQLPEILPNQEPWPPLTSDMNDFEPLFQLPIVATQEQLVSSMTVVNRDSSSVAELESTTWFTTPSDPSPTEDPKPSETNVNPIFNMESLLNSPWALVPTGFLLAVFVFFTVFFIRRYSKLASKENDDDDGSSTYRADVERLASTSYQATSSIMDGATQVSTDMMAAHEVSIPGFLQFHQHVDFNLSRKIAQGGGGSVHLAIVTSSELRSRAEGETMIIAKSVTMNDDTSDTDARAQFHQEISILWMLRDSNFFAKLVGYSEHPMIALMKFYTLGSLDKFLMKRVLSTPKGPIKLTKKVLIALLKDISSAIRDLHNFGIVHYDIKLDDDKKLRGLMSDLGVSRVVDNKQLLVGAFQVSRFRGISPFYAAPDLFQEVFYGQKGRALSPYFEKKRDIYAFGVVICEIMTGQLGF